MSLTREQIVAMAVAAIAEEEGCTAETLRVTSFREIRKSPLEQYLADRGVTYHEYQLGDSLYE